MAKKDAIKALEGNRTIVMTLSGRFGESKKRKVTIPKNYDLTFGPFVPGGGKVDGTKALRIYNERDQVMACFTDVDSFFEESLDISKLVIKEEEQILRKETEHGAKNVAVKATVEEWVPEDALKQGANGDSDLKISLNLK